MHYLIAAASSVLILLVLWDAFETMLLPRRVTRPYRFARLYFVYSWRPWAALARSLPLGRKRNALLSLYGPLSVLGLFSLWAAGLVVGFALLQWSLGSPMHTPEGRQNLGVYAYFSGVTLFTLGFGDVTPAGPLGRALAVAEAGIGFGFLAAVIGYLPVLYQSFSRREVTISLLDARAGSPPTAAQILGRLARYGDRASLDRFLEEWERWAAEVLESHISFPVLSYYRSQHDNQSWLAAMTAILDTSALVVAGMEGVGRAQAWLTFAMGRHVVVDLSQVFQVPPMALDVDRFPSEQCRALRADLRSAGLELSGGEAVDRRLAELRGMYEPFLNGLSRHLVLPLPPVVPEAEPVDNWQTSAWMRRARGFGQLTAADTADDHAT
jgi:hypothetical protein